MLNHWGEQKKCILADQLFSINMVFMYKIYKVEDFFVEIKIFFNIIKEKNNRLCRCAL